MSKVHVVLPPHLRNLAGISGDLELDVVGTVTARAILDAIEVRYPMLQGAIRDHGTLQRRAFLRFFACEQDLSHDPPDTPLPEAVASGKEPFIILGAIAGGSTSK
jgi:molybdopterin synthase sulfur carrier subunit